MALGMMQSTQFTVADVVRPRSDFTPKRKTEKSCQSMILRMLIIPTITLPVLIRMCFATPYVATTQALLITTTAMVSTLIIGIVLYVIAKHMYGRRNRRRQVFLSRRQASAARRSLHINPTAELLNSAVTNLSVCAGPFVYASNPMGLSINRNSVSSDSMPSSPVSPEMMRMMLPVDNPPSYCDVAMAPIAEVHRYSFQERAETPPPSYEQAVGFYL